MSDTTILPFNFHCGICCEKLFDHNALFTSCGHFFCLPSQNSSSNCTRLVPDDGAKTGHCEQCGQLCAATDIKEKAQNHNQKVQEFLFADCITNLQNVAKIAEFRMKHERILTVNVVTLRKRLRQLEAENKQLKVDKEKFETQLRDFQRLQAQVVQLEKEKQRYSTQMYERQKRKFSTDVRSKLQPLSESKFRYPRHRPSSPAISAMTSLRRNITSPLSTKLRKRRPSQASSTLQKRSLVQQTLSNSAPRSRLPEHAMDPRRFQSSRFNARRRDNYVFGTESHTTHLSLGTMPSGRFSTRRQTQSNTWQERVSVLPRPTLTPDLMRRLPRRENDESGVNAVTSKLSRR